MEKNENIEKIENNKKIDIESNIKNILFFSSIKEGIFDFNFPIKQNIEEFNKDKTKEPSNFCFEYLFYKEIINELQKEKINQDIVFISDNFLTKQNCKNIFIKYNAIHKKNIIIFIQNVQTFKWNLIYFLNLEEQIKNCFDITKKKPIIAKILSSNPYSNEDDYILNSTMDKLENCFEFKIPDDIQFEVDSFNIHDQPNTAIFLINFAKELLLQENNIEYIKKFYEEGSNLNEKKRKNYLNSFNNLSDNMNKIYEIYNSEYNEFIKNNDEIIIDENGINKKKGEEMDEFDDDLNSDEEEEALKIMERESIQREKEKKLKQKLSKLKMRSIEINNIYKDFGVIKEEDNESESESIDIFGKMKEKEKEKKENIIIKNDIKNNKIIKKTTNNLNLNININLNNNSMNQIKSHLLNTDDNITSKKIGKSEKKIKLNILKELEEAIHEFELEQEPIINTEENINKIKSDLKNNPINNPINEIEEKSESKTEKNSSKNLVQIKIEKDKDKEKKNEKENDDKNKKKINKENNNINKIIKKEKLEFKKRGSVPKSTFKEKNLQFDFKYSNNKNIEKLKKSFTSTKRPEVKEIFKDDLFKSDNNLNNNSFLIKKKSMPLKNVNKPKLNENNIIINNSKSNNIIISQRKSKENQQLNSNSTNNSNKNFNSNNNKEKEKIIKKEPIDNLSKKIIDLNNIIKTKKLSQKNSKNYKKLNEVIKKDSPFITKTSTNSQKSSFSKNSEETTISDIKNINNKIKPFNKEKEKKIDNNKANISSSTDNPINILPPQKVVERNAFMDLINNKENNSRANKNKELTYSLKNEQSEGGYSSNINIENIFSDDFSEKKKKSETSEGSYIGRESRTKKSKVKRSDKSYPPNKLRNSKRYSDYGKLDREDANKICGCIGEQANGICNIF